MATNRVQGESGADERSSALPAVAAPGAIGNAAIGTEAKGDKAPNAKGDKELQIPFTA